MMKFKLVCVFMLTIASVFADEAVPEEKTEDEYGNNAFSYTGENFSEEIEKKVHFVMFYHPKCGYCKKLAPTWDELAKTYNSDPEKSEQMVVAKVNCEQVKTLCLDQDVTGYPTLKLYMDGLNKSLEYRGPRNMENFDAWLTEKLVEPTEEPLPEGDDIDGLVLLNKENFDEHTKTGNHFVFFSAPWCSFCNDLAPTWKKFARKYATNDSVTIGKLDCTTDTEVCKSLGVRGYPTLLFFKDGEKIGTYYGDRELSLMEVYVNKMLSDPKGAEEAGAGKPAEFVKGQVMHLDVENFAASVKQGTTFVKFYAPWCGHCKNLAPIWDDLAMKLEEAKNTRIAKVDCTLEKELCHKYEIQGYPTLKIFKDGKLVSEHKGPRDLDALYNTVAGDTPHDEL